MKIIISRKGFDSSNSGCPSPIMPDGTMLSFPIPGKSELGYSDIEYKGQTYLEIWKQLCPKRKEFDNECHLDPDIRAGIRVDTIDYWKPAFGQCDAAQTHLQNQGVTIGDLFLFFGWFRQTETSSSGQLRYQKGSPNIHAIYGYMQIGDMLIGKRIQEYLWHPHADEDKYMDTNNTLYIPTSELIINSQKTGFPGYGTLRYAPYLVLTEVGMSRSKWKILDWFNEVEISYHNKESIKNGYFQSAGIGQEFVIPDNDKAVEWAKTILIDR